MPYLKNFYGIFYRIVLYLLWIIYVFVKTRIFRGYFVLTWLFWIIFWIYFLNHIWNIFFEIHFEIHFWSTFLKHIFEIHFWIIFEIYFLNHILYKHELSWPKMSRSSSCARRYRSYIEKNILNKTLGFRCCSTTQELPVDFQRRFHRQY